jgi:hypothetical protein
MLPARLEKKLGLLCRNGAAALAFAGVLAGATVVAGLAAALTLARILALTIVLGLFGLGFLWRGVVAQKCGPCQQTCCRGSESYGKFSAIHSLPPFVVLILDERTTELTAIPSLLAYCPRMQEGVEPVTIKSH